MKSCLVFTGGPLEDCDAVRLPVKPAELVIACDSGLSTAWHFGITPALVVGDFDSFGAPPEAGIEVCAVSSHKDDTDTMLGLRIGLERGCDDFLLIGGFGGRLDHTLANLQALAFLCEHGAHGEIRANRNRAWAVRNGTLEIQRDELEGWYLSVFAWGGVCSGVTLEGVAYPLDNAILTPEIALGTSNEFAAPVARITAGEGTLLVVASWEPSDGR